MIIEDEYLKLSTKIANYCDTFQDSANSIFWKLDKRLLQKVSILAIPTKSGDDKVIFEPSCQVEEPSEILKIKDEVEVWSKLDQKIRFKVFGNLNPPNPQDFSLYAEKRKSIYEFLQSWEILPGKRRYISNFIRKEKYLVLVFLEVSKEIVEKYKFLRNQYKSQKQVSFNSFFSSVATLFLDNCYSVLSNEDFKRGNFDPEELFIKAGKNFFQGQKPKFVLGTVSISLYEVCNKISCLTYEGEKTQGKILFARPENSCVDLVYSFEEKISISSHRKVRKLLEMCREKTFLISDSEWILGIGKLKKKLNNEINEVFFVEFLGQFKWNLSHGGKPLMRVRFNTPFLPEEEKSIDNIKRELQRVFKGLKEIKLNLLASFVEESKKQTHGTVLVISEEAQSEANRLKNQCFMLKKCKLKKEHVSALTSIDGALLIDPNGICYACGVILDGEAKKDLGTSERGARFNSSLRYYSARKEKQKDLGLVVLIVSEDGMVSVLPELKPKKKHSEILEAIDSLERVMMKSSQSHFRLHIAIKQFEQFRFYLNGEECKRLNTIFSQFPGKELYPNILIDLYKEYVPNPEMNDSYYLLE